MFVLNLVDGCIPSDMATDRPASIEEERRLLYVAMTRARDQLHLIQPERFYVTGQHRHGDRHVRAARTRFLPNGILHLFEHAVWPTGQPGRPAPQPLPRVDVAASLRGMWTRLAAYAVRLGRAEREKAAPRGTAFLSKRWCFDVRRC